MDFYVSWYPGDPDYPIYDDACHLLISITSVARDWKIGNLPKLPKGLVIDSGAFRFANTSQQALTPRETLTRQIALLGESIVPTIVCAADAPILDSTMSSNDKDRCIAQTIAFGYEFRNLIEQWCLPPHIIPMAVVQGYDTDSLCYCAQELRQIGFPLYGLGSLALLRQHTPIMERVIAVTQVLEVGRLHILGVSAVQTAISLRRLGIHSLDSARSAKAAAYNEILYSNPFRRFGIWEPSFEESPLKGRLPRGRRLDTPLPCECPICRVDASRILAVGYRSGIRCRALHNYYHLKLAFCEVHGSEAAHVSPC